MLLPVTEKMLDLVLLHEKQCRALLIAMHQPVKTVYKQGISRAVKAQKSNFQHDWSEPSNIISPCTLYRSPKNKCVVCYQSFYNGPTKNGPIKNNEEEDVRAGSWTLFPWVQVHYSSHDAIEPLVPRNAVR